MSRILISLCLLIVLTSILSGLGCSAAGKSTTEDSNLQATAGELKVSGYSFTINPCLYTYRQNATEVVKTTVSNLSDKDAVFSMGDGKQLTVSAKSSKEYKYRLQLVGEVVRMRITKISSQSATTGLAVQEALVLKIEPRTKGE